MLTKLMVSEPRKWMGFGVSRKTLTRKNISFSVTWQQREKPSRVICTTPSTQNRLPDLQQRQIDSQWCNRFDLAHTPEWTKNSIWSLSALHNVLVLGEITGQNKLQKMALPKKQEKQDSSTSSHDIIPNLLSPKKPPEFWEVLLCLDDKHSY